MATVPGGIFDTSTGVSDRVNVDLISSILDRLGGSDSPTQVVPITPTSGNGVVFRVPETPNNDLGTTTVLAPSNDAPLVVGTTGNVTIVGGGYNDSVFGGAGADSVLGGLGDEISFGATFTEDDIVSGLRIDALTGAGGSISDAQAAYLKKVATSMNAQGPTLQSIDEALQILSESGNGSPSDLSVKVMRLALPNTASNGVANVDLSGISKDLLIGVRLKDLVNNSTLLLTGAEKVIAVGEGELAIGGSQAAIVVGDTTTQIFVGGSGNDTLVGGGGNDTLMGGAGSDVFGFTRVGHYTIADFVQGTDKLAFEIGNADTLAELQAAVTSVTNTGGNTTFNFGSSASITLVGVSVTSLTSDMVSFDITVS